MSTDARGRHEQLMAAVNEAIDRLHRSLDLADSDFFCECAHVGCKERITLSRTEYASLLEESRPVLAVSHASRVNIEQATRVLVERHRMTPHAGEVAS